MKAARLHQTPVEYVIFISPDFPMVPLSGVIEVLSITNKVLGYDYYSWKFASEDGNKVVAASGIPTDVDYSLNDLRQMVRTINPPKVIMVCAGNGVEKYETPALMAGLREFSRSGIMVGGISTGAYLLAASKILDHRECVVHWEILPQFRSRFQDVNVNSELYRIDDQFCTCAGGLSAIDMTMMMISKDHDTEVFDKVCGLLVPGEIRFPEQRQRLLKVDVYDPNSRLASVVKIMEKNIAEPLSMEEIAGIISVSRRQLERWFEKDIGCSPAYYYLGLRLETADYLLKSTSLSIIEIAEKTGFAENSHFSSAYRKRFDISPSQRRKLYSTSNTGP